MSKPENPVRTATPAHPAASEHPATSAQADKIAQAEKNAQAEKIAQVAEGIEGSRKLLVALGDESRQQLILRMMEMGDCSGVRVCDVAERTHLSRQAVSHHFQVMRDAGLLKARKDGTRIYYYFDPDMRVMARLIRTLQLAVEVTQSLPDRGGDRWTGGAPRTGGERWTSR